MVWAVITCAFVRDATAGSLILQNTVGDESDFYRVSIGPAQRCYTFSCYDDKASFFTWNDIQTVSWLLFFDYPNCQGDFMKVRPSVVNITPNFKVESSIESFMAWESGMYPTRGLVDVCSDERAVRIVNGSFSSRSPSDTGVSGSFNNVSSDGDDRDVEIP